MTKIISLRNLFQHLLSETKVSKTAIFGNFRPLLHISPRVRSIMCTNIVAQILLYKMHCALFSCKKLYFKNNFRCFI